MPMTAYKYAIDFANIPKSLIDMQCGKNVKIYYLLKINEIPF